MTLFDAICTTTNGNILAEKLGLTFKSWERSAVSESTYAYLTDSVTGSDVKVRFSLHDDRHFDEWETLATLSITKFAQFDPEEFGEEDAFSVNESAWEVYWLERNDYFIFELNYYVVGKMQQRIEAIRTKWATN
jgi:hypothetical protein